MSSIDTTAPEGALKARYTIKAGDTAVEITTSHGPDWFAVSLGRATRLSTTLYLRRNELRELRDALDEIDMEVGPTQVDLVNVAEVEPMPAELVKTDLPGESPFFANARDLARKLAGVSR